MPTQLSIFLACLKHLVGNDQNLVDHCNNRSPPTSRSLYSMKQRPQIAFAFSARSPRRFASSSAACTPWNGVQQPQLFSITVHGLHSSFSIWVLRNSWCVECISNNSWNRGLNSPFTDSLISASFFRKLPSLPTQPVRRFDSLPPSPLGFPCPSLPLDRWQPTTV